MTETLSPAFDFLTSTYTSVYFGLRFAFLEEPRDRLNLDAGKL